jgi:hypothetical protein
VRHIVKIDYVAQEMAYSDVPLFIACDDCGIPQTCALYVTNRTSHDAGCGCALAGQHHLVTYDVLCPRCAWPTVTIPHVHLICNWRPRGSVAELTFPQLYTFGEYLS